MKHFSCALLAIVSLGLIASCSTGTSKIMTLENGTVITQTDVDYLDSLQPKADAIFNEVLSSSRAIGFKDGQNVSISENENAALKDKLIQLLKDEVGADYMKYVVEGSLGEAVETTSAPAASRRITITDGADAAYQYEMLIDMKYCKLAWGTWCWAVTQHRYINLATGNKFDDNVLQISATIVDEVNPSGVTATHSMDYSATATGKPKYGFFPNIKNIRSTHWVQDDNIYNGFISRSYIGSM